jgi:hypothetical protein
MDKAVVNAAPELWHWMPPAVTCALMLLFGWLYLRSVVEKFDGVQSDVASLKKMVSEIVVELKDRPTYKDNAAIAQAQWEVVRKMEREQYARVQVEEALAKERSPRRRKTDG